MGCANSKESRCKHCHRPYSPARRSHSVSGLRRFQKKIKGSFYSRSSSFRTDLDDDHVVSQNSTTLDAVNVSEHPPNSNKTNNVDYNFRKSDYEGNESQLEVIQDKVIDKKNPEPLLRTRTGELETINTWELMEGLEDVTPRSKQPNVIDRCLSFHKESDSTTLSLNPSISQTSLQESSTAGSPMKPVWLQMVANEKNLKSIISDFDPEIISTFRKALDELSPSNALNLKSPDSEKIASPGHNRLVSGDSINSRFFPKGDNKVVVYFTTLRGIRKTYEDCCYVTVTLKGTGVRIDERDVSMHYGFREELSNLLAGSGFGSGLPRVFVKGKCIGGAEEVRRMHEDGNLEKALQGCEMMEEEGDRGGSRGCSACGDVRFVPCAKCSGSCKLYIEENNEEGGAFHRCPNCNENGIVRCLDCCYW